MSIPQGVGLGIIGDELGKQVAGDEVSAERTVASTVIGTGLGAAASGALVVAGSAAGIGSAAAAAPIVVPLAAIAGVTAFIKSRW